MRKKVYHKIIVVIISSIITLSLITAYLIITKIDPTIYNVESAGGTKAASMKQESYWDEDLENSNCHLFRLRINYDSEKMPVIFGIKQTKKIPDVEYSASLVSVGSYHKLTTSQVVQITKKAVVPNGKQDIFIQACSDKIKDPNQLLTDNRIFIVNLWLPWYANNNGIVLPSLFIAIFFSLLKVYDFVAKD